LKGAFFIANSLVKVQCRICVVNIAVMIYHDVLDFEVSSAMTAFKTAKRFTEQPLEVYSIHRTRASVLGSSGLVMTPSYAMSGAPEPDVLVVCGGAGIEKLVRDPSSKDFIQTKRPKYTILGSNAPILYGEYGLLEGRCITVFPALAETVWKFNPSEVLSEPITRDAELFTISRSAAMVKACLAVIDLEFGVAGQVAAHLGLEMP
jgi:transcriptional regulator GlxA family with amidase domain